MEFIDVFATKSRREPAIVDPMNPNGDFHLEGSDFTAKEVYKLVQHVHVLLRSSVLEQLIDDEARSMLLLAFLPG